jgi:hypothetical protein
MNETDSNRKNIDRLPRLPDNRVKARPLTRIMPYIFSTAMSGRTVQARLSIVQLPLNKEENKKCYQHFL